MRRGAELDLDVRLTVDRFPGILSLGRQQPPSSVSIFEIAT